MDGWMDGDEWKQGGLNGGNEGKEGGKTKKEGGKKKDGKKKMREASKNYRWKDGCESHLIVAQEKIF
jgi:hypothetical protein